MKYLATAFTITLLLSSIFIMGCGDEENGGGEVANFPPVIERIQAYGTTIKAGTSTPFKVSTTDWDGDIPECSWEATAGQFDQTTGESVVWTAPDSPTTVEVTLSVTDGKDTVTGTVSIDVKDVSDIVGTWNLLSMEGTPLSDYKDEITLVNTEAEEETEFNANVGYSSQKHTYNADETYTEVLEFEYRIPKEGSGLPLISNRVSCTINITGTYSLTGSTLTLNFPTEEFSVETDYDESKYDEEQTGILEGYLENLEEAMKELKGAIEPGDISIDNDTMEWTNNSSWERTLVTVWSD